jgi:thiol-disulfide isomerase/thioredoxin
MKHMRSAVLMAALAVALLALPVVTSAQSPDGSIPGFAPNGEYGLVVNGKPVAAEDYQNDSVPAFLIVAPSSLPSPVLLTPRAGTVQKVHVMKVAKQKDGTVNLLSGAVLGNIGSFQMAGESVSFTYEGRKVSLSPKPPVVGLRNAADLKAKIPEYLRGANAYKPNPAAVASLKKTARPATVHIVFGSWCPHCRQHVPMMLKVEDMVRNPNVKFEYFGLPRPPQAWQDPEVKRLGIKGVPTGIVYINGKEVGRIEGQAWNAPEVQLNKLLNGQGAAKGGK